MIITLILAFAGIKALELLLPSAYQGIRSQFAEYVDFGWALCSVNEFK